MDMTLNIGKKSFNDFNQNTGYHYVSKIYKSDIMNMK